MIETGGNNADNDEPAKQANGLDIILSLACAGSFVGGSQGVSTNTDNRRNGILI